MKKSDLCPSAASRVSEEQQAWGKEGINELLLDGTPLDRHSRGPGAILTCAGSSS